MENSSYITDIGLEVHVELNTATKIFCGCSTAFGSPPNTNICPVCMGMPGTLPVLNRRVLESAIRIGLATECHITEYTRFDRKNYFYPDNPQNYQISQLYAPVCTDGGVQIHTTSGPATVRIHEMHMEEDAGKLIHEAEERQTRIDYNRAGVPLVEIVTEPDMHDAEQVIAFLEELRLMISYLGVSDCKMQEGSMRVDVNLSVRPAGSRQLGVRTEMKNLSSFRAISRAIEQESNRQITVLEQGEKVWMETRRWDEQANCSYVMRSKEDTCDYRYFPDPDLPVIHIAAEWINELQRQLPEKPAQRRARLQEEYGLSAYDTGILTGDRYLCDLFEQCVAHGAPPKKAANWILGDTLRLMKETMTEAANLILSPARLAELIDMVETGKVTTAVARQIFVVLFQREVNPLGYAEEHGLLQVMDEECLRNVCLEVVEQNAGPVSDYLGGKEKAMGFLVGQAMKKMKGKADPTSITKILTEILQKRHEMNTTLQTERDQ